MAKNLRAIITVQKAQVVSHNVKSEAVTSYQRAEAIAYRNDSSINQWFYDTFSDSWNGYCSTLDESGNPILNQAACEIGEGVWTPSRLPVSGGGGGASGGGSGGGQPSPGGGAPGGSWGSYEVNPGLTLCSTYDENGDPIVGQVACTSQGGEWRAGFCSILDENGDIITDEATCIAAGGGTWYPERISIPLDDILFWSLSKNLTETVTLSEVPVFSSNKSVTETLSLIETFVKAITWGRNLTDAFTLDDAAQIDKDYYGNKGNVAFILDTLGLSISKVATESLPITELYSSAYTKPIPTDSYTVGDIYSAAVNKIVSENLSLLESQVKGINLGKSDSANFSDTYYATLSKIVTDSMTITEVMGIETDIPITESFSISDSIISEINKVIADAFTLDDSTLIDKDYYGNKGNICTVSDVIALAIAWGRSYSDSISTSDSANIANISGRVLNGASFNRITLN